MPELPNNQPPQDGDELENDWPEIDAIINILDDARHYAGQHGTPLRVTFQIDIHNIPNSKRKFHESYTVSGVPLEAKTSADANKIAEDMRDIISDEMDECFPNGPKTETKHVGKVGENHLGPHSIGAEAETELECNNDHGDKPLPEPKPILANVISVQEMWQAKHPKAPHA